MTRRGLLAALALVLPAGAAAQSVSEVQVAPPSVNIRVGERTGLLATAFDRIGNDIPTVRIIWSSNNIGIAKVDQLRAGDIVGLSGKSPGKPSAVDPNCTCSRAVSRPIRPV